MQTKELDGLCFPGRLGMGCALMSSLERLLLSLSQAFILFAFPDVFLSRRISSPLFLHKNVSLNCFKASLIPLTAWSLSSVMTNLYCKYLEDAVVFWVKFDFLVLDDNAETASNSSSLSSKTDCTGKREAPESFDTEWGSCVDTPPKMPCGSGAGAETGDGAAATKSGAGDGACVAGTGAGATAGDGSPAGISAGTTTGGSPAGISGGVGAST